MKKRAMLIFVLIFAMVAGVFSMAACSKDNKGDGSAAATEAVTEEPVSALVGSWVYEDYADYVYVFNADGTGSYSTLTFTYEDKGDKVSLLFEGNTVASEFEYIIEGNKLTLTDSFGSPVVYIKK